MKIRPPADITDFVLCTHNSKSERIVYLCESEATATIVYLCESEATATIVYLCESEATATITPR